MKRIFTKLVGLWLFGIALPVWFWLITLVLSIPIRLLSHFRPESPLLSESGPLSYIFLAGCALLFPLIMGWILAKTVVTPRQFFGSWWFGEAKESA